ncbi:TPA: hypothetical protein ACRMYN_006670, partial [Pseudomonas aeruginosa]
AISSPISRAPLGTVYAIPPGRPLVTRNNHKHIGRRRHGDCVFLHFAEYKRLAINIDRQRPGLGSIIHRTLPHGSQ